MKEKIYAQASRTADILLSLIFPRRCPVCQDIVRPKGAKICPACREKISWVHEPACRKCGKQLSSWEQEFCLDCSRHPRSFDAGVSLMRYDAVGRASMKGFKYGGRQEYAAFYMEEIVRRYGQMIRNFRAEAVVPVPVHRSRYLARGYNQAELLARELSLRIGIPEADLLVRRKKTVAQKKLGAGARQKNLASAFAVKKNVAGRLPRRLILVDDIYTTGSTLEACAHTLLAAGVDHIFVVTVCIGGDR